MAITIKVSSSLVLLFAAVVCRATVNLTEQQLRVCQGHDAILANCSTKGTGGLVWLFSGQADVRFQPSTIPTIGLTQGRMNQGSHGSVFNFTLDSVDNETDTYRSTASVSNIQLSDNATSITCAEPTPKNPISIVVIVLEVCPSPSSTIIAAITSTIAIPDRSSTTESLSLSIAFSTTFTSPTVSPVLVGGVNAAAVAVPIVLILLLVVIVTVVGVVLLLIRNIGRSKEESFEIGEYEESPKLHSATDGDEKIKMDIAASNPIYDQVGDDIKSGAKNDNTDGGDTTDQSNGNGENGHIKEEEQSEKQDSNDKTDAEIREEGECLQALTEIVDDQDNYGN